MRKAVVRLEGVSPLQYGRYHNTPKNDREDDKAYEERTWINRLHLDAEDNVIIPPMCFKHSIAEAAQFLGKKIPGKGKSTYTKHFKAGVLVTDPMVLSFKKDDAQALWLFVPSDGKHGSGRRVEKCFPTIPAGWVGEVTYYILDNTITEAVFKEHLEESGKFIGLLSFRPINGGYFGRFKVNSVTWIDDEEVASNGNKKTKAKAAADSE